MNARPLAAICVALAVGSLGCNSDSKNSPEPPQGTTEVSSEANKSDREPAKSASPATAPAPSPANVPTANNTPASGSAPATEQPPPAWLTDLASSDAAVRSQAATYVSEQEDSTSLLLQYLDYADPAVRRGAAFGMLSEFDTRQEKQTSAIAAVADTDDMVRRVALQAMSQWSHDDPVAAEAAIPTLQAVAKNPSRDTFDRSQAVRILGRLGVAAQPALIQAFVHDSDANLRKAALAAAMRTSPDAKSIVPSLIEVLQSDPNASLRRQAALHLQQYGQAQEVQNALAAAFTDSDSEVRLEAATSLASQGTAALPLATKLLSDTRPQMRLYAVFTLGKMGRVAEPALPKLRQLTSDSNSNVAKTAAGVIRVIEAGGR